MTIFNAIYALVHASAIPPKAIADEAGVRYGYLMRAADPNADDVQFQARWIAPVTKAAQNDVLIRAIAVECGGVFVRLSETGQLDAQAARSLREFGEYLTSTADAQIDNQITPTEFERLDEQAHKAIAAILAHVAGLRARVVGR